MICLTRAVKSAVLLFGIRLWNPATALNSVAGYHLDFGGAEAIEIPSSVHAADPSTIRETKQLPRMAR